MRMHFVVQKEDFHSRRVIDELAKKSASASSQENELRRILQSKEKEMEKVRV